MINSEDDEWHAAEADRLLAEGQAAEAALAFRRAHALAPERLDHLRGLAEALAEAGDALSARAVCARLIELRPESVASRLVAGNVLARLGLVSEAIAHYKEAVALRPSDVSSMLPLGALIIDDDGDLAFAIDLLRRCLRDSPDLAAAHFHIGRAWTRLGIVKDAKACFERCLELDPDDPFAARTALDALMRRDPDQYGPSFVRLLFDQYADHFDETLVVRLRYRGPQIVAEAIWDALDETRAPRDILDLGCGTGLLGPELKPLAGHLAGVDLSPKMIEKARERRLYDSLTVGDIVETLAGVQDAWDIIAAADVLVYLGNLSPLFTNLAQALREGGLFAATVEESPGPDHILTPTKRFQHHPDYIRRAASAAGLETLSLERVVPRHEKNEPVQGLAFVLRKPLSETQSR